MYPAARWGKKGGQITNLPHKSEEHSALIKMAMVVESVYKLQVNQKSDFYRQTPGGWTVALRWPLGRMDLVRVHSVPSWRKGQAELWLCTVGKIFLILSTCSFWWCQIQVCCPLECVRPVLSKILRSMKAEKGANKSTYLRLFEVRVLFWGLHVMGK